jgi:hypothetical protein
VLLAKTGGGPPGEWRVFIARRPAGSEGLSEREAWDLEEETTDGWSICSELAVAETALAVAAAACGGDDVLA